jgi:RhtB (resistance to homoserine/threonine) family protein
MKPDPELLVFSGAVLLLTLTPGADTFLIIRNAAASGWRSGISTTLGICAGLFAHATLSAVGLAVLLVRSAWAFEVVRWGGVFYLVYLGIQSLRQGIVLSAENEVDGLDDGKSGHQPEYWSRWRSFMEGLLTNLLNPKVVVFYLAFLPQFIRPDDNAIARAMLLASIHVLFSFLWLGSVTLFLQRVRSLLAQLWVCRGLQITTGGVLLTFGLRLALVKR